MKLCGCSVAASLACACGRIGFDDFVEPVAPGCVAKIALGHRSTCANTTNNDLYCWGRNVRSSPR